MKKLWNYLPVLSVLTVMFISYISFSALCEIAYFVTIFLFPVIANAIMMYLNFNEFDKKRRNAFCFFSAVLQILPMLVLLMFSDSKGRSIVLSYISYIVVISVLLFLLLLALTHIIKQPAKTIKRIYARSIAILFAAFFAWFYLVCYLF